MRRASSLLLAWLIAASCATARRPIEPQVLRGIEAGTGASARLEGEAPGVPAGVDLADGLSQDEAVAVALWNNAAFRVSVTQLGFARADLVDAGMLTNPALSLLFPLGPKQLEATLRLPAELLWERPRRMKAAGLSLDGAAQSLVQSGLDLALSVRVAYVDLLLARDRQALAGEASAALRRIDTLTQSRLAEGDVAELDARAARVEAVRAAQDAERAATDAEIAGERLRLLLGVADDLVPLTALTPAIADRLCGPPTDLLKRALAARPDLRAAELGVEAAATRLGWERSRVVALTAILDANGQGREGFEAGPGLDLGLPIFNRNQGGRLRARAELQRASAAYLQLQRQVGFDVREASLRLAQARRSADAWHDEIVAPLRVNQAAAEASFSSGESSYLFVLENARRLIDARLREREILAERQRAQAQLERATGGACGPGQGGVS